MSSGESVLMNASSCQPRKRRQVPFRDFWEHRFNRPQLEKPKSAGTARCAVTAPYKARNRTSGDLQVRTVGSASRRLLPGFQHCRVGSSAVAQDVFGAGGDGFAGEEFASLL